MHLVATRRRSADLVGFACAGLALLAAATATTACGSRCKQVDRARAALRDRPAGIDPTAPTGRGADLRVTVPFARANELIADLLRDQPITVPLAAPDLGPIEVTIPGFTATAREVHVRPGAANKIRVAMTIDIHDAPRRSESRDSQQPNPGTSPSDPQQPGPSDPPAASGPLIATLVLLAEVEPQLVRAPASGPGHEPSASGSSGSAELSIGVSAQNLLAIRPELGPDARRSLGAAVERWLPAKLRDRLPRFVVESAASKLGSYLTGAAYRALQTTLLRRTGELTRLRLRLPDVPVAKVAIRSTEQLLVVEIATDLPVRRGLAPVAEPTETEVGVTISGSAVAELANWAIDQGHAPRWYDRAIRPRPDGQYRPRFDYIAEDRAHPFKVYLFQERGGCSYFRVGVRPAITMRGDQLEATALDRSLEASAANPVVETAAWVKYFVIGSIDRSKRVVARTQLTAGNRSLATQVIGASLGGPTRGDGELHFALRFTAPPP
jgi:hypothetical protein